jgi:hypothetical protein
MPAEPDVSSVPHCSFVIAKEKMKNEKFEYTTTTLAPGSKVKSKAAKGITQIPSVAVELDGVRTEDRNTLPRGAGRLLLCAAGRHMVGDRIGIQLRPASEPASQPCDIWTHARGWEAVCGFVCLPIYPSL